MKNDELKHYGVPGMKWGVRKAKEHSQKHQQRKDVRDTNKMARKYGRQNMLEKPNTKSVAQKIYKELDSDPSYNKARKAALKNEDSLDAYKKAKNIRMKHVNSHKKELVDALIKDMNLDGKSIEKGRKFVEDYYGDLDTLLMRDKDWHPVYH